MAFSCSSNNINDAVNEQLKRIENWETKDDIPSFILDNKYMNAYNSSLYEYGGVVNSAIINQIKNQDLLLKIITSCDSRLDKKLTMETLKKINFGENRLFDFYFNYSTRQIATLRYRMLYGSKKLANQINLKNLDCKVLNPDTVRLIKSIGYSGNEQGSLGFIIELKRLKMNEKVRVDHNNLEKIVYSILQHKQSKPTFKELDVVAAEIIKSTMELNPNDTFQVNYTGPYLPYDKEKMGLKVNYEGNAVFFSLQLHKLY